MDVARIETRDGVGYTEWWRHEHCTTPCALDLPLGEHVIGFRPTSFRGAPWQYSDIIGVTASEQPTVLLRRLPRETPSSNWTLGVSSMVLGALAVALGVSGTVRLFDADLPDDERPSGWLVGSMLAGGATLVGLGIWLVLPGAGEQHSGATTQFRLPPP